MVTRLWAGSSAVLLAVLSCGPTLAGSSDLAIPDAADRRREDAGRLVFLLQYVGSDYAVAVADGRVVDEAEYSENREFAARSPTSLLACNRGFRREGAGNRT